MPRLVGNNKLSGQQFSDFSKALLAAFSTTDPFDIMIKEQLGKEREHIALGGNMKTIVFKVIRQAEDEAWTQEMLIGARASSPHNPELIAFAQQFGLAPLVYEQHAGVAASDQPVSKPRLEKFIVESNGLKDVLQWRERLGQLEGQVCRIEVPTGSPPTYGTGFLLGSHVILTNHHVIQEVKQGLVDPKKVILRFDYKQMRDGVTVSSGTEYHLANDWEIDSSPLSPADFTDGEAEADELDYALLRLDEEPGNDPVGGPNVTDPNTPSRGWITAPAIAPEFKPDTALFILQHPKGAALKLALDTNAIIKLNSNRTRVRYRTNTDEGSSGSPCFDANWNLVALHHLGDPGFNPGNKPLFNQGIPLKAILERLKANGKDSEIGK